MQDGERVPLVPATSGRTFDIPHCRQCSIESINNGAMDGFDHMVHGDTAYTQFRPKDAPNYFRWAHDFVLNDNFFASALGPSFPNHLYSIAAQSGGAWANPRQDFRRCRQRRERQDEVVGVRHRAARLRRCLRRAG